METKARVYAVYRAEFEKFIFAVVFAGSAAGLLCRLCARPLASPCCLWPPPHGGRAVRDAQGLHVLQMGVGGKSKAEGRAARLQKNAAEEGLKEEDEEVEEKMQQMAPITESDRLCLVIDQHLLS